MAAAVLLVLLPVLANAWFPSAYPEYCSQNMDDRDIPPLSSAESDQVTELKQVQVMIRHGARTPYSYFSCWKDYDVTWNNCNVSELMLASPSYTQEDRPSTWLFRKLYDGSPNALGGNCLTGQLLLKGYEQQTTNGEILYQAYLNSSLPLFASDIWDDLNEGYTMYLRSDDEQRTLMSGQIMLHSMFNVSEETTVTWHTGDYNLDQIYPNSEVCPRLNTISSTAFGSAQWLAENGSASIDLLNVELDSLWGKGLWTWDNALDCLMTTVCTDRQLPGGSGAVQMSDEIFNAAVAQVEYEYAYKSLYNNSLWAKTAVGNTAWHMRNNLQSMLDGGPLKFALFSAHDTSVMPLLAALLGDAWDGKWASYAALVSFEVYSASSASQVGVGGYYFRMIYNGKVVRLPDCSADLCPLDTLLETLSFGQQYMPCSVDSDSATTDGSCGSSAPLDTVNWVLLLLLSLSVGGLVGASAVVFYDKHQSREEDDRGLMDVSMQSSTSGNNL